MAPVVRFISSLAIVAMTLGSVSTLALVASTGEAVAKSSKSSSGGSHGKSSSSKSRAGTKGNAYGLSRREDGAAQKPGYCSKPIGTLEGIAVYNVAVSAVQGASDALVRAAARLADGEVPAEGATIADAEALIAALNEQPWTQKNRAAVKLLKRQREYLIAREDLEAKKAAQREARSFASTGKAMSGKAISALKSNC